MMIVAPNSLVRQEEEGAQEEEEEEEAGGRRSVGSIGTPTPVANAPTGPTQSGVSDARTPLTGVGRQSTVEVEGARDQSYPLTIGMERATERRPKL